MAEIVVTAFVQEWKRNSKEPHPDWAMKVCENHQRKKDDKWVTVGRTYYTVKAGWDVSIDFRNFKPGDRVKITGKLQTEGHVIKGENFWVLTIKAVTVEKIVSAQSEAVKQAQFAEEPF